LWVLAAGSFFCLGRRASRPFESGAIPRRDDADSGRSIGAISSGPLAHSPRRAVEYSMDAKVGRQLKVSRTGAFSRGIAVRCPNCGEHSLFAPRALQIHERCPACGTVFDAGGGVWLGPLVINYTLAAICFVLPVIILGVRGVLPLTLAIVLAVVVGGFVLPFALYRWSWGCWLAIYFFFAPEKLLANGATPTDAAD
jgi:uncharacterized protein (DUF983 family)